MPVYFVQSIFADNTGGPVKIGLTHSLRGRFSSLRCGSPLPLRCLKVTPGDFMLETEMHQRFKALRLHGEWFQPAAELLECADALPWLSFSPSETRAMREMFPDCIISAPQPPIQRPQALKEPQITLKTREEWAAAGVIRPR
jgi:hypothetical protein